MSTISSKIFLHARNLYGTVVEIYLGKPWWQQVIILSFTSVIYMQFTGMLGTKLLVPEIGWSDGAKYFVEISDKLEGRFVRWDSGYYADIARYGYSPGGPERAFFPLYPLLNRLISNYSGLSLYWSGLLVSLVCYLGACLILYRWVLLDYGPRLALHGVFLLCIFPMSFFFIAFYPTSLFLLLSLLSIYFARRGQFVVSGFAIALAGAARPTAILLSIPYIFEFWQQKNFLRIQWLKFGLGALISPLGLLGYLLFLAHQASNANPISSYALNLALNWQTYSAWPWKTLLDGIKSAVLGIGIQPDWFSRALVWHDLTYALFGLMVAMWALFHLRASSSGYLLASILFFYANHGPQGYAFWSMPRHVVVLFPLFLCLSILTTRIAVRLRWLLFIISVGLLGMFSAWFATGRWVA